MTTKKSSDQQLRKTLIDHLLYFYRYMPEKKIIPNAAYEKIGNVHRSLCGIAFPFHNILMGAPEKPSSYDQFIADQTVYFKNSAMPFVWYVNEDEHADFQAHLLKKGFISPGTLQGVIKEFDKPIVHAEIPEGFTLERAIDKNGINDFTQLVCDTFGMLGTARTLFEKVLVEDAQGANPLLYHWLMRRKGEAVSAVTTMIKDDVVSFWNGATKPEYRKKGLSTALRRNALQDAIKKGSKFGISYLMAEALAFGICQKLGYESKWRFKAFIAP